MAGSKEYNICRLFRTWQFSFEGNLPDIWGTLCESLQIGLQFFDLWILWEKKIEVLLRADITAHCHPTVFGINSPIGPVHIYELSHSVRGTFQTNILSCEPANHLE